MGNSASRNEHPCPSNMPDISSTHGSFAHRQMMFTVHATPFLSHSLARTVSRIMPASISPRTVITAPLSPITRAVTPSGALVPFFPEHSRVHHVLEQSVPGNVTTRTLLLNRPSALHALSAPMCSAIHNRLRKLIDTDDTRCVVIAARGSPRRAFCAGGDVRAVYHLGADGIFDSVDDLFRVEFRMNSLLGMLRPAVVSILDGIVMGGGAGLSVHGKYRVATRNTMFAMPECAIALSPDVGASCFLSRLPWPGLGMYLALTGARLKGAQAKEAGIATHFVPEESVDQLVFRLQSSAVTDEGAINAILKEFEVECGADAQLTGLDVIRRCFTKDSVDAIITSLEDIANDENGKDSKFATSTLELLRKGCPTSVKIAFEAQVRGATLSLDECLKMEFRIVTRCLRRDDFYAGVKSALITKDRNPSWNPANIKSVSDEQVQRFFDPLENDLRIPELELGEDEQKRMRTPFTARL